MVLEGLPSKASVYLHQAIPLLVGVQGVFTVEDMGMQDHSEGVARVHSAVCMSQKICSDATSGPLLLFRCSDKALSNSDLRIGMDDPVRPHHRALNLSRRTS
jgi:type II secretory pathway predicted ATPase ExeA